MRLHTTIAVTAMAVSIAAPGIASARAKHVRHVHHARHADSGSSTLAALHEAQEEIAELRGEVNDLKSRMNAPAQASMDAQAASAKADQALAAAAQANSVAVAAKAEADKPALPDVVKWAANTSVSGRMYFNASAVDHKVNGDKTGLTDNGGGFNIKRFYLGVDHKFNDVFSANLTTDVSAVSGVGMSLYIKKAYLQAKLNPALVIRLGASDMPWIPYAEGIYGYRHIEQTLIDRTKFGTSSDWGVHVSGDLAGGLVSYQVSAVDGAGYRDVHFSKSVDFEGRISAKYQGFNLAVGGYTGKLGKNLQGVDATAPLRTYNRIDALAAYSGKVDNVALTVGGEYFWAENKAFNSTGPLLQSQAKDTADGYSLFASVSPVNKWSVFGRYDWVKPSKDITPGLKDQYFNVGIQYSPAKIVDLALVYKHEKAEGGAFATGSLQSGVIGCSLGASSGYSGSGPCLGEGTYDEIGLYGQFRF
jgi:hypothetical protein